MTDAAIKDKIRKVLALANDKGATEGERAAALEMATAMMLKHNITDIGAGIAGNMGGEFRPLDPYVWETWVFSLVSELTGTVAVTYKNGLEFNGREENVAVAWEMADAIRRQIEQLYKLNLPRGMSVKERANYRRTFKQAAALKVYVRAQEILRNLRQQNEVVSGCTALVVASAIDQLRGEADAYVENKLPALKNQHRAHKFKFGGGSIDGYIAGDSVDIQTKVTST